MEASLTHIASYPALSPHPEEHREAMRLEGRGLAPGTSWFEKAQGRLLTMRVNDAGRLLPGAGLYRRRDFRPLGDDALEISEILTHLFQRKTQREKPFRRVAGQAARQTVAADADSPRLHR
jgi:hypothetical protein